MNELKEKYQKSLDRLVSQLGTIRTGRANPDLLSRLQVMCYGAQVPIQQVATISVPENMMLLVNVFDQSVVPEVEKAIMSSDLGLNPATSGTNIRIPLPALTEDRRKEMIKVVRQEAESARVSVRNARRDANTRLKSMEKDGDLSEDDLRKDYRVLPSRIFDPDRHSLFLARHKENNNK